MAAAEEASVAAARASEAAALAAVQKASMSMGAIVPHVAPASGGGSGGGAKEGGQLLDLEGVTCEPSEDGSTLWHFHCDGATYPARLVNLPCPVEIHKTHDHAMYYKCADIGQILIVYEDENALEEAESAPGYKVEGFPSYYHSGLTPPMKRVVERRFGAREHKSVAPPRSEVIEVEKELMELIERISKDTSKGKGKSKAPSLSSLTSSQGANKIIEDVVEEVVDYEPWMDDNGRKPKGIEFDSNDVLCTKHPEVWLDPKDREEVMMAALENEPVKQKKKSSSKKEGSGGKKEGSSGKKESSGGKKDGSGGKKDGTKKKSKQKKLSDGGEKVSKVKVAQEEEAIDTTPQVHTKKGIPAKKTREEVDEVTHAAALMTSMDNDEELQNLFLDDLFDFDDGDELPDMDLS